jgi:hypothetical protein
MSEETFMRISTVMPWILLILINIPQFRALVGTVCMIVIIPFAWIAGPI